ncbi:uncharacterized protein MONBRDRAFT_21822 [Monosiga brevicollis MX1]|uniref:Uncharacterized protein n=1 Tax=Monosiga brevicollis TaxID=81824 RepID=A9UNQ1_MONBE|nr:uncharacterized protein MONBRDRAFT_21822 [Monosiga brevicollis MX1]EDQ92283.1 predicted protein [Monosiga brevicollis MX1]|eukprot:XP_001742045.1 hypothetical protein [Monosiga brevicollis MX1]
MAGQGRQLGRGSGSIWDAQFGKFWPQPSPEQSAVQAKSRTQMQEDANFGLHIASSSSEDSAIVTSHRVKRLNPVFERQEDENSEELGILQESTNTDQLLLDGSTVTESRIDTASNMPSTRPSVAGALPVVVFQPRLLTLASAPSSSCCAPHHISKLAKCQAPYHTWCNPGAWLSCVAKNHQVRETWIPRGKGYNCKRTLKQIGSTSLSFGSFIRVFKLNWLLPSQLPRLLLTQHGKSPA